MKLLRSALTALTALGQLLLSLSKRATGYGLYLVFRYGTEAQATPYVDAALKARRENRGRGRATG